MNISLPSDVLYSYNIVWPIGTFVAAIDAATRGLSCYQIKTVNNSIIDIGNELLL